MSNQYFNPYDMARREEEEEEDGIGWDQTLIVPSAQPDLSGHQWPISTAPGPEHHQFLQQQHPQQVAQSHQQIAAPPHQGLYQEPWSGIQRQSEMQPTHSIPWYTHNPTMEMNYIQGYQQGTVNLPDHLLPTSQSIELAVAGPSTQPMLASQPDFLYPVATERSRGRRAASLMSGQSSRQSQSDASRSVSPNVSEMSAWGRQNEDGTWSCSYPGCTSKATHTRGCDLRKHYKRHTKSFFCRVDGCPQATEGGFSSKKDRARHEAKHNPAILCEWDGCNRLFSRVDNMKDHVKRIHERKAS